MIVAACVVAWLVVMERDERLYQRGYAAGGHLDVPGTAARAERDFRAARFLNPDRTADVGRALVLSTSGSRRAALRVLEDVVRDEPDNLEAWAALRVANQGKDPSLDRRVQAAARRLDPVSAERRARRR